MGYVLVNENQGRYAMVNAPSTIDNLTEGAGNAAYGLAKGLADPVYGLSQLALHGANSAYQAATGPGLSGLVTGKPNNAMQRVTDKYDNLISQEENNYQAATPGSIPAGAARFLGNMLYPIRGGGALKSATTGAAVGLSQPVVNTPDYAGAKTLQTTLGAALGGVLPSIGKAVGGMYNTMKPAINPAATVGDSLLNGAQQVAQGAGPASSGSVQNLTGNASVQALIDKIRNSPNFIPGSNPTTAQVAGIPQLVMAEKTLANNPAYKEALLQRSIENNKARLDALSTRAKTPQDLSAATDLRGSTTSPMYDAAWTQMHPIDDTLTQILARPSAQKAIARGQQIAAEKNQTLGITGGTPATADQQVATGLVNSSGSPITRTLPGNDATAGTIPGQTLQYLKLGIRDLTSEGKQQGIGALSQDALQGTGRDLNKWLIDNAPAYKAADSTYAKMSVPINDMQTAQAIQEALKNKTLNSGGDIQATLNNFNAARTKAMKDQPYGISPEASTLFDNISKDLQRETASNSIRSAGSDTAFNLQAPNWLAGKLYGNSMEGATGIPTAIGGTLGAFVGAPKTGALMGYTLGKNGGEFIGNRVNEEFQKALLNPEYFAQLLQAAAARNQPGLLGGAGPMLNQGNSVMGSQILNGMFSTP